jgi:quinol monooxygenase YgiN
LDGLPSAIQLPILYWSNKMYGLIGKMKVVSGQRDALVSILIEGIAGMPGCLSYIVALDPTDEDAIWITEVWISQTSHQESLSLPSVQQAITLGRPLIAGFGERFETTPIGGHGLSTDSLP